MSVEFAKFLKEKIFDKGTASISLTDGIKNREYNVRKYPSHNNAVKQFLKDLERDLTKPIEEKKFKFNIHEMKGFKRTSLISFIKQNNLIKDFENVFHSFYKNFGIDDLFNNFHIKTEYSGKLPKNHPYNTYLMFLLRQDFTNNTKFNGYNFLQALSFNFCKNEENYAELKESLYMFLDTHYDRAKESYVGSYGDTEERKRSFDLEIYEKVKRNINANDMCAYEKFWQDILIYETSNNLITVPKEEFFVFNVEHSYVINKYPSITNTVYAKSSCNFVCNFFNNNFSEYLGLDIIRSEDEFSKFVCEFKNPNIKKEDLPHIINKVLQLHETCNLAKTNYLKPEYKQAFGAGIEMIKNELEYLILQNTIPTKEKIKSQIIKI